MFNVEVTDEYRDYAEKLVDRLGPELVDNMLEAGDVLRSHLAEMTKNVLNGRGTKFAGRFPTGQLMQGWTRGAIKTSDNSFKVDVFNRVPYALIHEEGGVIHPKRVKALAIPNYEYRLIVRNGVAVAPREYDPGRTILKFVPAKSPAKTRGYLIDKNTDELAYTLVASVRIKPTSYITRGIKAAMPDIEEIIDNAVVTAMGGEV
jgi:hypothetical protein